ncbi:bacteriocin immunity protein [Lactiplantibacillus pentosus]|uniref:Bacteriocin immunity protein n=2 Tax=Lactiplantibacillus pentosus TaxID=1589 RepID=A0AB37RHW9_LACPE|nr:bacteriocin immunity protein [Lactiplantibacillus pentosus]RMW47751.1 bacteriocin immunity protein [Lactiplantibacillus pentosus]RMW53231.1 bacteriocin immunity protein [Lactiplantibacillus pentosus]RMW55578.1 bacteriocin immunity protein [Lactiplantibacillus pentosus]
MPEVGLAVTMGNQNRIELNRNVVGLMDEEAEYFFQLIDQAYAENLENQPSGYKKCLLKAATDLSNGKSVIKAATDIYLTCQKDCIVPMGLPPKNRMLHGFIHDKLKSLSQKELRNLNIGHGLIATHFTFGPFL